MHAVIRYCTGTGNTTLVLRRIAENLLKAGWTLDMEEIHQNKPSPEDLPRDGVLILGFPTLGFTAPDAFLSYLKKLEKSPGRSFNAIALCGASMGKNGIEPGASMIATRQVAAIMKRRGYHCAGTYELSLPVNWTQVMNPPNEATAQDMIHAALPAIDHVAENIAAGRSEYLKTGAVKTMLGYLVGPLFRLFGRRLLGLGFIADKACNGCTYCQRTCPFDSIVMKQGLPRWKLSCNACNRCINRCPQKAIQLSPLRLALHSLLNILVLLGSWNLAGNLGTYLLLPWWLWPFMALAMAVLLTVLQVGPVDAFLRYLARTRLLGPLFMKSWTHGFRRYANKP